MWRTMDARRAQPAQKRPRVSASLYDEDLSDTPGPLVKSRIKTRNMDTKKQRGCLIKRNADSRFGSPAPSKLTKVRSQPLLEAAHSAAKESEKSKPKAKRGEEQVEDIDSSPSISPIKIPFQVQTMAAKDNNSLFQPSKLIFRTFIEPAQSFKPFETTLNPTQKLDTSIENRLDLIVKNNQAR